MSRTANIRPSAPSSEENAFLNHHIRSEPPTYEDTVQMNLDNKRKDYWSVKIPKIKSIWWCFMALFLLSLLSFAFLGYWIYDEKQQNLIFINDLDSLKFSDAKQKEELTQIKNELVSLHKKIGDVAIPILKHINQNK